MYERPVTRFHTRLFIVLEYIVANHSSTYFSES